MTHFKRKKSLPDQQKNPLALKVALTTLGLMSLSLPALINYGIAALPPHRSIVLKKKEEPNYRNWGLMNKEASSHIHALDAWRISEGSRDITVAVIDTGIDANHPDLKANIWKDPKCALHSVSSMQAACGTGYDFVKNSIRPTDDHGHGTHVAGIIGAVSNPLTGVSGVAHRVSLMAVKYYSESASGSANLRNTIRALNYAIDHGARIINYSGGGPEFAKEEYEAIKRAEDRGILVVAAAGNERQNTDIRENYYYPAAYGLSNIISVAATDIHNKLLPSSNWGRTKVDVAAPGENIFSTLPGGRYGSMTGTSQATAFVSGLAALLLSKNPNLKPHQIRELIKLNVDRIPTLMDKVASGGRVNAYLALMALGDKNIGIKSKTEVVASRPSNLFQLMQVGE